MVNLLVDITNMFYRSMFSTSNYGIDKMYTYNTEFECEQLMRKICIDLALVIRQTNANRVMLCKDSKPWRADIEIIENEGYKGQRKKNTEMNWENVYKTQNEFFRIAKKLGFIVSDIDRAEADDIIAMWAEELYKRGESCIIISGDEDIRQLIKSKTENGKYTFICALNPLKQGGKNPSKKIYHDGTLEEWVNSTNSVNAFEAMFNTTANSFKSNMKMLVNDEQFEKVVVNGDEIVMKKFFMGDDGDNIPAFYTWNKLTKAGKPTTDRITNKKYETIITELCINKISDINVYNVRALKSIIERYSKDEMDVNIMSRITRQKLLVELNSENFPEDIVESFKHNVEYWLGLVPKCNLHSLTMQDMLNGTKYISENYIDGNKEIEKTSSIGTHSSIFKDMEKVSKSVNTTYKPKGLFN